MSVKGMLRAHAHTLIELATPMKMEPDKLILSFYNVVDGLITVVSVILDHLRACQITLV